MTSSPESYIRLGRVEPKDSNASLHPYQMSGCGRPEEKFNLCVKLGKSVSSDILKLQEDEYSLHSLCKWLAVKMFTSNCEESCQNNMNISDLGKSMLWVSKNIFSI